MKKKENKETKPVLTEEILEAGKPLNEVENENTSNDISEGIEVDDEETKEDHNKETGEPNANAGREFDPGKDLNYREFDYGNLMFECNRCGHRELLQADIEGGIQITLPTTDKHNWTIVCPRCNNSMKYFFTESAKKKEVPEKKESEETEETDVKSTLEVVHNTGKESKNESKKESKKE